jgi:hypothetical protein
LAQIDNPVRVGIGEILIPARQGFAAAASPQKKLAFLLRRVPQNLYI